MPMVGNKKYAYDKAGIKAAKKASAKAGKPMRKASEKKRGKK